MTTAASPARRQSPGARLLQEHSEICNQCHLVGMLGLKPTALCGAGKWLFVAAVRARATRRSR